MNKNIILLTLFLTLIVFLSGCVDSGTPEKATTTQQATTTVTPTTISTELILKVGETAKTSKIEVTVFSIKKTKSYDYYSDILKETRTSESSPGKIFVLVDAEVKNIGTDRLYFGATKFSVTDSEGYKYDAQFYLGSDKLELFKELYQNQKMRGKVLFEVPEYASGLKLQCDFGDLLVGTKLATWKI